MMKKKNIISIPDTSILYSDSFLIFKNNLKARKLRKVYIMPIFLEIKYVCRKNRFV